MRMSHRRLLIAVSILLFAATMPSRAFTWCGDTRCSDVAGIWAFLLGWSQLGLAHWSGVTWFANPLLVGAWLSFGGDRSAASARRNDVALCFSLAALLLGISALLVTHVKQNSVGPMNVYTGYFTVQSVGPGYWFWIASMTAAVLAAAFGSASRPSLDPDA